MLSRLMPRLARLGAAPPYPRNPKLRVFLCFFDGFPRLPAIWPYSRNPQLHVFLWFCNGFLRLPAIWPYPRNPQLHVFLWFFNGFLIILVTVLDDLNYIVSLSSPRDFGFWAASREHAARFVQIGYFR